MLDIKDDKSLWPKENIEGVGEVLIVEEGYYDGIIEMHEKLAEVIARNLTAWDTSKDKSQGLLPEVYLSNKVWYKRLTGEEYVFIKAIKKFNIE
jgi:hypothetical protein